MLVNDGRSCPCGFDFMCSARAVTWSAATSCTTDRTHWRVWGSPPNNFALVVLLQITNNHIIQGSALGSLDAAALADAGLEAAAAEFSSSFNASNIVINVSLRTKSCLALYRLSSNQPSNLSSKSIFKSFFNLSLTSLLSLIFGCRPKSRQLPGRSISFSVNDLDGLVLECKAPDMPGPYLEPLLRPSVELWCRGAELVHEPSALSGRSCSCVQTLIQTLIRKGLQWPCFSILALEFSKLADQILHLGLFGDRLLLQI